MPTTNNNIFKADGWVGNQGFEEKNRGNGG